MRQIVNGLSALLQNISAIILMALMIMTSVDVVGRYGFNSPLKGGTELTEFALSALIFCALPIVTLTGGHVVVELLNWRVSKVWAARANRLLFAMIATVSGALAWGVYKLAARSVKRNELSEYLQIPVGYVQYIAVGCLAITALLCAWKCLAPDNSTDVTPPLS